MLLTSIYDWYLKKVTSKSLKKFFSIASWRWESMWKVFLLPSEWLFTIISKFSWTKNNAATETIIFYWILLFIIARNMSTERKKFQTSFRHINQLPNFRISNIHIYQLYPSSLINFKLPTKCSRNKWFLKKLYQSIFKRVQHTIHVLTKYLTKSYCNKNYYYELALLILKWLRPLHHHYIYLVKVFIHYAYQSFQTHYHSILILLLRSY